MLITLLTKALQKSDSPICFGPICGGLPAAGDDNATVGALIGSTMAKFINIAFVIGGFFTLFYLLWGAIDWILAEGDKEKLAKAQAKLRNAVIGIIIMVVALTLFGTITGDILGIITWKEGGWTIQLPSLAP